MSEEPGRSKNIDGAFRRAVLQNDADAVRTLLQEGADADAMWTDSLTPIHLACVNVNLEIATLLLAHGVDVNAAPVDAMTPLHLVAMFTDDREQMKAAELCRHLMAAGADPALRDAYGETAGEIAKRRRLIELASLLNGDMPSTQLPRERPRPRETSSVQRRERQPLLHRVLRTGDSKMVERLLKRGINPHELDDRGHSPLHRAAETACLPILRTLLDAGLDPNLPNALGYTPVHKAAGSGNPEALRMVIARGGRSDATSNGGYTPLHEAAVAGPDESIRVLVESGTPVNARTERGRTALHSAALSQNEPAVRALLAAGADPAIEDHDGKTAEDLARGAKHRAVAEIIHAAISIGGRAV